MIQQKMKRYSVLWILIIVLCVSGGCGLCPLDGCECTFTAVVCDGSSFHGSNIPTFAASIAHLTFKNMRLLELVDYAFVQPHQIHHRLQNLTSLTLDNCSIHKISEKAFAYLPHLQYLTITNSELTNDGFLANLSQPALQYIVLSGNQFKEIPDFVLRLNKLYLLDMSNNRLTSVNLTISPGLTSLQDLILSGNNFSSLTPDTFVLPKNNIQQLSLVKCNIQSINSDVFAQFPALRVLGLSGNPTSSTELKLALQALGNNTNIRTLQLNDMNLPHITAEFFSTLKDLTHLNMSNNGLTTIDEDTFKKNTKLSSLVLTNNHLASMLGLNQLDSLAWLNLSHNKIQNLYRYHPNDHQLTHIDMSYNSIEKVPTHWLYNQTGMILINLCCNKISTIGKISFYRVIAEKVDLSHNSIEQTQDFGVSAHKLDLSYNKIKLLSEDTLFKHYRIIEEINLSHNQIDYIEPAILMDLLALERLDLSHNRLGPAFMQGHLMNLFDHLVHMRELDLSYNDITVFQPFAQFRNTAQLRKLSLQGNSISDLQTFPCDNLARSLQYLDLSRNELKTIDRVCISKLIYLKEANFSLNPLVCTCSLAEFTHWLINDTHHMPVSFPSIENKQQYSCHNPGNKINGESILDYHPIIGSCEFHPRRNDGVNSRVVGITVGLILVGILVLALVLYFGKVCQKLKNIQYNWQIRYKEVDEGDMQVIL